MRSDGAVVIVLVCKYVAVCTALAYKVPSALLLLLHLLLLTLQGPQCFALALALA